MIDSVDVIVDPTELDSGTTTNFTISVDNTSDQTINWIKITRPSTDFTLGSIIATGYTVESTADSFTLTDRSINPGSSKTFTLTSVLAFAPVGADSADWIVQVSDDAGGANPLTATGSVLGTAILYVGSRVNTAYFRSLR